jgi:hypothetical protein
MYGLTVQTSRLRRADRRSRAIWKECPLGGHFARRVGEIFLSTPSCSRVCAGFSINPHNFDSSSAGMLGEDFVAVGQGVSDRLVAFDEGLRKGAASGQRK